ncbi:MAG: copper oxidase [Nitrospiraceae bacterium]
MKYTRIALLAMGLLYGANDLASAATINFTVTDVPGRWFDTGVIIAGTRSLAIAAPGDTVEFHQAVESSHTVTSLIWPSTALPSEKIDQDVANISNHSVTLTTPGLYVFVCKLHPYMLGGVIVDDAATPAGLDIGNQITLLGVGSFDSNSNLGLRLLRAFFIVTNPSNWKDYTKVGQAYTPVYPAVPVVLTGGAVVPDLNAALQATFDGDIIPVAQKPAIRGVGQVWVDTQYELSAQKGSAYPGTMTVVRVGGSVPANNWKVIRKIALPSQLMNNGHNMWASHNQNLIYQTEWHGRSLFVIDRVTGAFLKEIEIGDDPAHVMTRVDTGQVHVTLNGDDYVVELNKVPAPEYLRINRYISMQNPLAPTKPTQPHAHWMGFDGKSMATPNANSNDSTLYDFNQNQVVAKTSVGALPIAVGMMPDSSKYYVSNYLSHSLSVMNGTTGANITTINLLGTYDPVTGLCAGAVPCTNIGALPIQTPVSPDGKFVITGNTLTGTITIVDTATDAVVKTITCDPGCHGVNFGAKKGGGYYAYVTSKFANRLIVLDYDPNNDGIATDAVIAGWVVLANDTAPRDAFIYANLGQGGQGVLPVPNVYNGWVQKLPDAFKLQLTPAQRNPFPIP